MFEFYEQLNELLLSNTPFVTVTLVDGTGSIPQESGAKIIVTQSGLSHGTVGGGKVEKRVIEEALTLLEEKKKKTLFTQWNLGQDIGMTCGGSAKFFFETFNLNVWEIVVFGAGHVSNALIHLLLNLDCRVTCIDPRIEWLGKLPHSPKLTKLQSENLPAEVKNLNENAFVLLMTMGHGTDKPILLEILKTRTFPYLGVIGSRAKAARLKQDIEEEGLPDICKEAFYCPIGLNIGSNHPQEIAISIVAQLVAERDKKLYPKA
jgi:xanthine dehydrogenase accessory factor